MTMLVFTFAVNESALYLLSGADNADGSIANCGSSDFFI